MRKSYRQGDLSPYSNNGSAYYGPVSREYYETGVDQYPRSMSRSVYDQPLNRSLSHSVYDQPLNRSLSRSVYVNDGYNRNTSFIGPYSQNYYNTQYQDNLDGRMSHRSLSRSMSRRRFSRYDEDSSDSSDYSDNEFDDRISRQSRSRRRKVKNDWRHTRSQKGRLLTEVQAEISQLENEVQARRVAGERTRNLEEKIQNLYKLELDICKGM